MKTPREDVIQLAAAQRQMIVGFVASFSLICVYLVGIGAVLQIFIHDSLGARILALMGLCGMAILYGIQITTVVRLSRALNDGSATAFYAAVQFLPMISVLALIHLNGRAT
ncbi:MAG TPA: hypothetical protein VM165_23580, partial [Planctomycetaceae bacterium]|nr:hypothetical protein [Planctomycetaceae bacterium]